MKALAIDTTESKLIIVVINGDKTFTNSIEVGKSGHSSIIIPSINELLLKADLSIKDIENVAVVVGPGSFTGIRIGVSAMTAIAFAIKAHRISISSFELLAYGINDGIVGVDAGHGNNYIAFVKNHFIDSTKFVESNDGFDLSKVIFTTSIPKEQVIIKVLKEKIANNDFVTVFEPYYMRKSQAEREKDEI